MEALDTVVVGAGVVGLAVARAVAESGREVLVLEKERHIGTGISSRNSEVMHAGLYYPTGSLKARLCVRGRHLLDDYVDRHGVGAHRCGKLVVACDEAEEAALERLALRAQANGADVTMLNDAAARAMEPALRCRRALWSPASGVVDSHALMLAMQGDLERSGGSVALGSRLRSVVVGAQGMELLVLSDGDRSTRVRVRQLINAAGLHACALARSIDVLDPAHIPTEHYGKGNYFSLHGRAPFQRLIYPVPHEASLGTHYMVDLGGQAKFGPDLQWLDERDPDLIDYRVDVARADRFAAAIRRYWPALPEGALSPAYSGVRPKIHGPDEAQPDFRIDGPARHGVKGLVNLFGIESPGLTSALAIGEFVADGLARDSV